jgi:hypothetical protein
MAMRLFLLLCGVACMESPNAARPCDYFCNYSLFHLLALRSVLPVSYSICYHALKLNFRTQSFWNLIYPFQPPIVVSNLHLRSDPQHVLFSLMNTRFAAFHYLDSGILLNGTIERASSSKMYFWVFVVNTQVSNLVSQFNLHYR